MKKLLSAFAPYQLYKTLRNMGATKREYQNMKEELLQQGYTEMLFSGSTGTDYLNTWRGSTLNAVEKTTPTPKGELIEKLNEKLNELK